MSKPNTSFNPFTGAKLLQDLTPAAWWREQYREVWRFNPWTGTPRHEADMKSDPHGHLIWEPSWGPVPAAPIERALAARALDVQEGGSHYKGMAIQPFEYIHANGIGFAEGCVIKYVSRWRTKGGLEDLKKARHFLDLLIEAEAAKAKAP